MCISEPLTEVFDLAFGYPDFEKDRLTARFINQNLRYPPLSVVLRGPERPICNPTVKDRNRICRAERIRNNPQIPGRAD